MTTVSAGATAAAPASAEGLWGATAPALSALFDWTGVGVVPEAEDSLDASDAAANWKPVTMATSASADAAPVRFLARRAGWCDDVMV